MYKTLKGLKILDAGRISFFTTWEILSFFGKRLEVDFGIEERQFGIMVSRDKGLKASRPRYHKSETVKRRENKKILLKLICMSMPAALTSNSPGVIRGKGIKRSPHP